MNTFLLLLVTYVLNEGIFPDKNKLAKVVPIHKDGSTKEINYLLIINCFVMHFSKLLCASVPAFGQRLCFIGPSYEFISLAASPSVFTSLLCPCQERSAKILPKSDMHVVLC